MGGWVSFRALDLWFLAACLLSIGLGVHVGLYSVAVCRAPFFCVCRRTLRRASYAHILSAIMNRRKRHSDSGEGEVLGGAGGGDKGGRYFSDHLVKRRSFAVSLFGVFFVHDD